MTVWLVEFLAACILYVDIFRPWGEINPCVDRFWSLQVHMQSMAEAIGTYNEYSSFTLAAAVKDIINHPGFRSVLE